MHHSRDRTHEHRVRDNLVVLQGSTPTKYEAYNFGNAPTTTFPVFTGKHTLFIDDSDDDDDKGKGVASPSPPPPAKKAKYDGKGKGVASPSPTPGGGKHTRFPDSDDDKGKCVASPSPTPGGGKHTRFSYSDDDE